MTTNVLEYLEETVKIYPDKAAYVDNNETYTFSDLVNYGKSIGTTIANLGVGKQCVVIYLDKSVKVIASFMGILYSGNFYCPIDVDMPLERVKMILDILNADIIVTDSVHYSSIASINKNTNILIYDEIINQKYDLSLLSTIRKKQLDTDPVYVMFTSGSTGVPKGVTINHRAIIDFTDWMSEKFNITHEDNFGNQSPLFFDLSIGDVYCTLKNGCTNYLLPTKLFMFPIKLIEFLNEKHINIIFWVPSALCLVANLRTLDRIKPQYLEKILFCGEVMPNKQLNIWRKALPDATYVNLYGPCEATDACAYYIVNRDFADDESLPIGFPCENTDILVLNEDNKLVSGDEVGELCIRGSSLSLGYFNNPEKTSQAFVQNPLNTAYPEIIYRTGDLVKYNEYGELIYICRKDYQIKHMGHRIELGEIETATANVNEIRSCACIYDDVKGKIVLFYEGEQVDDNHIRSVLKSKINDYMIPNVYIYLKALPHNANGKIDRKKLKEEYLNGAFNKS